MVRSDESIYALARDIIDTVEREDFIYAIKHYGCYKTKTTARRMQEWLGEIC